MTRWMVDSTDPVRWEIAERTAAAVANEDPEQASHHLGQVTLANGRRVNAHVVHAVALIITNGHEIVMLMKKHDSGTVAPALPVGLIPSPFDGGEDPLCPAACDALKLAGIEPNVYGRTVGQRIFNRPGDVRVAQNDLHRLGIQKDDIFMVLVQAGEIKVSGTVN